MTEGTNGLNGNEMMWIFGLYVSINEFFKLKISISNYVMQRCRCFVNSVEKPARVATCDSERSSNMSWFTKSTLVDETNIPCTSQITASRL